MKRSQFLIWLIALGWGSQPSAAGQGPPAEATTQIRDEVITLRVVNDNWQDMRVFAVIDDRRIRLGTVTSMTTQTLEIRAAVIRPHTRLDLELVPVGSRGAGHIESIDVGPGESLEFRIANSLGLSFLRRT
ncbi:MAG: hypothetical protein O7I93_16185 [Gemmatimonadetes bacterium]|nr:hypothetical protein [Gemmatimonadota bacterium]